MATNWKQFEKQADMYGQRMYEAVSTIKGQTQRRQTMNYTGEGMQPRNVREAREAAIDRAAARITADTRLQRDLTTTGQHLNFLMREDLQEHQIEMLRKELEAKKRMAEAQLDAQGWANLGKFVGMAAGFMFI